MNAPLFRDRQDAAAQLADALDPYQLHRPLVLGIPRGGVITGAGVAQRIGADLDVALARKLRHPLQPELAIGAVSEDGDVFLNRVARGGEDVSEEYLRRETERRHADLQQRRQMFRDIRPAAAIEDRTVIVVDDGIATGSTMLAALEILKTKELREVIVAVPVAPPERLQAVQQHCDHVVCLASPPHFRSIGEFYGRFDQVGDDEAREVLQRFAPAP